MAGTIRQRSPGSFELRFMKDGLLRTATVKTDSKKEAAAELRRLMTQADQGVAPAKGTFGQWADEWLAVVKGERSPLTYRLYQQHVEKYLRPRFGQSKLGKLDKMAIRAAWADLNGKLAPSSIRTLHRILSSCLALAVENNRIPFNPAVGWKNVLPKVKKMKLKTLDFAQARQVVDAVRGTPMFAPVVLGLALGARRGEIAALTWDQIDLDNAQVTINAALKELNAATVWVGDTKTGTDRTVALPGYAVAELRAWKTEQAQQLLRLGVRQVGATPACTDPDGARLTPSRITGRAAKLMRRLGLPFHFHSLRHTSASHALKLGATIVEVQRRLGHSRPSETLDTYSHEVPGVADGAADKLDMAWRGGKL
jgi:integrase